MSNLLEKASIILTPTAYSDGTLHSIKPLQTLGSELVTNGDFATDSDWVVGAGWSIENGKANIDTSGGSGNFNQVGKLTVGKKYRLSLSAAMTVGRLKFQSDAAGVFIFSSDVSSHEFIASSTDVSFRRFDTTTSGYIDNVSIKEVIDADFDFTRSTTATRENSSGNIESVAANLPRIDFLGGTGSLLLEPQSTNLLTYSQDFSQSYWNKVQISVVDDFIISPNGTQNASKITTNSNTPFLGNLNISLTTGNVYTISCFVKKGTNRWVRLSSVSSGTLGAWFDLDNNVVGTVNSTSASIENYGNGWYRISNTLTAISGSNQTFLGLSDSDGGTTVTGTGHTVFAWGFQVEEQSYATSYIPTSGSTVTRNADVCNNAGSSDLINSTEGVLYAEIQGLNDTDATNRYISLTDGTTTNALLIQYRSSGELRLYSGGISTAQMIYRDASADLTENIKLAIKYGTSTSDYKVYINGSSKTIEGAFVASSMSGLDELKFEYVSGGGNFYGNVKSVAVFKEALTDSQLQCLTS